MWKNYLSSIIKDCQFKAPATEKEKFSIKKELNTVLPKKLAELYNETNGVDGEYYSYIWSTEQMVRENLSVWDIEEFENYKKPDNLLFFVDAGNGDLFGYLIVDGKVENEDIYVWNHEDGSQEVIASSLEEFIKGWYGGGISI
ncbi:SMI1 / KNR4 family protein [Solibacillus isronensis B3W22]|uniref:SMI1 / KNR4 family protein n=1 Tax=Solibacillus isronensis B3W22 TaxID=1224748 RepID=K1LPB8_9BACL|nr:SMI1/KNR4 family protein [Solibacillus isronensis]AMO84339.1 cell wall assembly protein [Solibacillus silvestris]EKB46029.1 SMI1 / KNR4 family protein [Solibacillus isronensis B3W22]